MPPDRLAEELLGLPVEQLVDVLRRVFAAYPVCPEEAAYYQAHLYLGVAARDLESDPEADPAEPERWGPWRLDAVGYPSPARYDDSLGPDYGLCQAGTCPTCRVSVTSNVKHVLCPVCGGPVHLS